MEAYFWCRESVLSSVVRIPAFQAGGPGSIPGERTLHVWVFSSAVEHRIADPQVTGSIPVIPSFAP